MAGYGAGLKRYIKGNVSDQEARDIHGVSARFKIPKTSDLELVENGSNMYFFVNIKTSGTEKYAPHGIDGGILWDCKDQKWKAFIWGYGSVSPDGVWDEAIISQNITNDEVDIRLETANGGNYLSLKVDGQTQFFIRNIDAQCIPGRLSQDEILSINAEVTIVPKGQKLSNFNKVNSDGQKAATMNSEIRRFYGIKLNGMNTTRGNTVQNLYFENQDNYNFNHYGHASIHDVVDVSYNTKVSLYDIDINLNDAPTFPY